MNTSAEVTLQFGDSGPEGYLFSLKAKQIRELQNVCGSPGQPVGIGLIMGRVQTGSFLYDDIYQTIRLGLIGGGTAPTEAKRIVDTYVDGCPLAAENDPSSPLAVADAVLSAVFFGLPESDGEPGKPEAGATAS